MPALAEAPRQKASSLSDLELESIEMFINFLRLLGWPKSVGEIYGLLFVSAQPLAMDDIMGRLDMSLGAASQGLKLLREFGAVRTVYMPGARKDHYIASGELSRFATSYIEEELLPRMRTAQERIKRLQYWLGKGQKVLALACSLTEALTIHRFAAPLCEEQTQMSEPHIPKVARFGAFATPIKGGSLPKLRVSATEP